MSGQPSEERPKDWMEIWYETGEITWQKPLSPEANARLLDFFDKLSEGQDGENASDGD
ncbi:hypothetical protein [Streptomyces scabiei]|uniref:hypothetical protein n=1 Tax=Streptomyces scabiei TaxID=1930 RepID=UPI000AB9FD2A|nr:hypothetical protein [Streptomyces scabiei]